MILAVKSGFLLIFSRPEEKAPTVLPPACPHLHTWYLLCFSPTDKPIPFRKTCHGRMSGVKAVGERDVAMEQRSEFTRDQANPALGSRTGRDGGMSAGMSPCLDRISNSLQVQTSWLGAIPACVPKSTDSWPKPVPSFCPG